MIARSSDCAHPPLGPAAIFGTTVAIAFVACRLAEAPDNPATIVRGVISAIALGVFIFARRSLVQRAVMMLAIEAVGGAAAFAYIDVPFIMGHQTQIGQLATTLYRDVKQSP